MFNIISMNTHRHTFASAHMACHLPVTLVSNTYEYIYYIKTLTIFPFLSSNSG